MVLFFFSLIYVLHDYLSMSYFIGSVGEQLSMSYLYHTIVEYGNLDVKATYSL